MKNKSGKPANKILTHKHLQLFTEKVAVLSPMVLQTSLSNNYKNVIFLSVCDGIHRATVVNGIGGTIEEAWTQAVSKAQKAFMLKKISPKWLKADVVIQNIPANLDLVSRIISDYRPFFLRKGIAFDENFKTALLESELNCNKIFDYKDKSIDILLLNKYLRNQGKDTLRSLPQKLYFFSCKGFICEEDNVAYSLYTDDLNYGRREIPTTYDRIKSVVTSSADFLTKSVKDDGQFIYGYFPIFNRTIKHYNILRHAGAIWSLINQYKLTGDENLTNVITKTIEYLITNHIVYMDEDTAFVLEKFSNELKLGGSGITTLILIEYMNTFNDFQYQSLCEKLGNGIIHMASLSDKPYYHVLQYPDFNPLEEFRTVYYDGEATFALCKLYSLTKADRWLSSAKTALDYFIDHNYEKYVDHWIAYAFCEYTKWVSEEKYYAFALKNVQKNVVKIHNQETTYHTYMELLMASFLLYDRLKSNNISCEYLKINFDEQAFLSAIRKRADYMLNGYLAPEYAMYLGSPATIANTFCVRHQSFRVRIDDVQHFLGGYYLFLFELEKIKSYEEQLEK